MASSALAASRSARAAFADSLNAFTEVSAALLVSRSPSTTSDLALPSFEFGAEPSGALVVAAEVAAGAASALSFGAAWAVNP